MKKLLFCCTALATFLLIQLPSNAADTTKAEERASYQPMGALAAAAWDLHAAFRAGMGNPITRLDKLATGKFSPPARARLEAAFSQAKSLMIMQTQAAPGKVAYSIVLPDNKLIDIDMTEMEWTKLDGLLVMDTEGRNAVTTARWASVSAKSKHNSHATFSDMTFEGTHTRSENDIWLGKAAARIAKLRMTSENNPSPVVVEDITFFTKVDQHDKLADIAYELKVKGIKVANLGLDDVRFIARLTKVDMPAWESFTDGLREMGDPMLSAAEKTLRKNKVFTAFGKSMAKHGTTVAIDELSVGFQGHKALISLTVSLAPAVDADFESSATITPKVAVRLQARVPVALFRGVDAMVIGQPEATESSATGQPVATESSAVTRLPIADLLIESAVMKGLVLIENDVVVANVEIKGGRLILNGKDSGMLDEPKQNSTGKVAPTGKGGKAARKPAGRNK